MLRIIRALYLIFFFPGMLLATDAPTHNNTLSVQELTLDLVQMQQLQEDAPFADQFLDDQGALWILGKTAVWRWALEHGTLVKMPLLSLRHTDTLRKIISHGQGVYVASDASLFQIYFSPKKVVRFDYPGRKEDDAHLKTLNLLRSNDTVWWVHQAGIIKIQKGHEKKPQIKPIPELKDASLAWFDDKYETVWAVRGGKISLFNLTKEHSKAKDIHSAREAFLGMQGIAAKDELYLHTNFTVLKFDTTKQELVQVIPVQAKKKVLAMSITPNEHSFLFNDTLLEIFQLSSKKQLQAKLPLPGKGLVEGLRHSGPYTTILFEKQVLAFKHKELKTHVSVEQTAQKTPNKS